MPAPEGDSGGGRLHSRRRPGRAWLTWAGTILAMLVGVGWYLGSGRYLSSDNAYVKADVIEVATRIDGSLRDVLVASDQQVEEGALLLRLDDSEARLAVAEAEAGLEVERAEIESLRRQVESAEASLRAAQAALAYREREAGRLEGLAAQGIASRASYDAAQEQQRAARDEVVGAGSRLRELQSRLGPLPLPGVDDHPRVRLKRVALESARLHLGYTEVRAPRAAQAGVIEVFRGEQVKAGERLFSLVGTGSPWVEVNLKETQLGQLRIGQPATVRVDAYPGIEWQARVSSIGPATGAEFALLPPENASGNWVKVVQRLPVRLELESAAPGPQLRAGMSAKVVIDTGEGNRRLRRLLASNGGTAGP